MFSHKVLRSCIVILAATCFTVASPTSMAELSKSQAAKKAKAKQGKE